MILKFKKDNSITGDAKTYCCLSVDALFFRIDIKIGPNGVEGFITEMQIEKKDISSFQSNIEYFISFVMKNWGNIVKAGFVFQINPLLFPIKPLVIHIVPSAHGKANNQIIEKLYDIKNILHNFRIEIVPFSFDGDNAYRNMNQTLYNSFIYRMINKNSSRN